MPVFASFMLRRRVLVLLAWVLVVAAAAVFAARLSKVMQGGAEPIPGSPSQQVNDIIQKRFGPGSLYQYLVVVHSDQFSIFHPDFRVAAQRVADALTGVSELPEVRNFWNF